MSDRIYKNVVVEVRPKLRSANVFVTFSDYIKHPKIVLNESSFRVVFKEKQFSFSLGKLSAITSPLLALKCSKNWLSFKFFIASDTGSFKTELLCDNASKTNSENSKLLKEHVQYDVQCKNCEKRLNQNTLEFKRVLPLPSEKCDPSDWFCHGHGHANAKFSLDPGKTDAFYTHGYVHLNQENITNVKSKEQILVCKFCFNWLGLKYNENTHRFWFNTVSFVHDNLVLSTNPIQDVYESIKNVFKTCLLTAVRIIFDYQDCNGDKNYLLLWILEKNLNVILDTGEGGRKNVEVAKTLFKFVEVDNDKIVTCWKNDCNVELLSISKPMMIAILKHLYFYNKIFPSDYAKSNDFLISYLLLYDVG